MTGQFATPECFRSELRDALLAHAATLPDSHTTPAAARPAPQRRVARRVLGARIVPALIAAVVAVAAILTLRSGGELRPQPATAAGVLNASAAALDRDGGSRALGPGDYLYSRIAVWWRYAEFTPHPYVVRSIQESWTARDGRGRSSYEVIGLSAGVSHGLPLTRSEDVQIRRSTARPFILSTAPDIMVSYAQLRGLPTDPTRLSAAIDRLTARYHVNQTFPQRDIRTAIRFEILRMLAELPTSASVRAALYRVLAATPGVRLLGRAHDSIGRSGMALAVNVEDAQLEMIIDPATGQLLQTSRTLLHRTKAYFDGKQPPGLINRATFLAAGIVTSTHTRVH